jgi:hypothetical protein
MDKFKSYVQGSLDWMLDPKDLHAGKEIRIPASKVGPGGVVRILKMDKQFVWIAQVFDGKPPHPEMAVKVPISSLYNFVDDVSAQMTLKKNSGNQYVDAVINGQAEFLGKGEDGVTYRVGDKAVKSGSSVPYHAVFYNRPHRTPEEALGNIKNEFETGQNLLKAGVPGILPQQFFVHDGRGFIIRPFIQVLRGDKEREPMTLPQLLELKNSVEQIHAAGYAIRDTIQVGLWNGHIYHYDLGSFLATKEKWAFENDMDSVKSLFSANDFDMMNPPTYQEIPFEERMARFKRKKG